MQNPGSFAASGSLKPLMPTGPGGGRRSTRRRWSRIAPRPRCTAPMASLEDTKDMRARIRALSAVLAVIGLVAPGPTFAQDPPTATVSTPQARTAVPPGGTLNLSLDEAVQRALENNADIAVERYNPELSAQTVISSEGYYDPYLFGNLSKTSTDTKGTNAFSRGRRPSTRRPTCGTSASASRSRPAPTSPSASTTTSGTPTTRSARTTRSTTPASTSASPSRF